MKISTEIASAAKIIGEERAVEATAKAGFDGWDFSLFSMKDDEHVLAGENYLTFAKRLKQIGLDNGIVCNQSHAPFPVYNEKIRSRLKRAIECTAEAGGKICIIHPMNGECAEKNAEMYHTLLPFAKECGVKIATENMWNWDNEKGCACFAACATPEDFCAHIDAVDDEFFVACLDLGHAEMMGEDVSAVKMIKALGSHLAALHIHDNDKLHDSHQIPFSMSMDFVAIAAALKEIKYNGWYTLEAYCYLNDFAEADVLQGLKNLAEAARRFTVL